MTHGPRLIPVYHFPQCINAGSGTMQVDAVIVGLDRDVSYYKLQKAMAYLLKNQAHFIVSARPLALDSLCALRFRSDAQKAKTSQAPSSSQAL